MPENTPAPPPPPPLSPAAPKRGRGLLNQAQLDALTKAEQISIAAKKPAYAILLAARALLAAFVDSLLADILAARNQSAAAIHETVGKESATATEGNAEQALVRAMQEIQAAARQKYFAPDPQQLTAYFIGQGRLDGNRAFLEQASQAVIEKLTTDTLPGITAAKLTALAALRQAYIDANTTQTAAQSDATTARAELEDMLKSITQRRMTLQFAADAEWPWHDPASAGIRKEFYLPPGMPFTG